MAFTGSGGVVFDTGVALSIGTGNSKKLSGGSLTNKGNASWTAGIVETSNSAAIVNAATGTFTTDFDGVLSNSGSATFTNAGSFTKSGGAGGKTDIQAAFTNTGSVNVNSDKLKLSGGGSSSNAVHLADGASLEIGANFSFTGGSLDATGADATGAIELTAGTANFSGTSGNANLKVAGGTANFSGNHNGTGKLFVESGAVTGNAGAAKVGSLDWTGGDLNGSVVDNSGTTTISDTAAKNLTGTLRMTGGGSSSSAVNIATGASLQVDGGTFAFTAGAKLNGSGKVELKSGTTTFSGSTQSSAELAVSGGTTQFSGTHTGSGKLTLTGGNLASTNNGSVTVGSLDWSGGSVDGKLTSKGNTTIFGATAHLTGELTLGDGTTTGTTTWSGSALATSGTAKIKNSAHQTFEATAGGTLSSDGSATFDNQGIFRKSGVGTVTDVHAQFTSTGAILADSGTLELSGGGSSTGTVAVGNGAKLKLSGADSFVITGTLATIGTGEIEITGSAATLNGTTGSASLRVSGGNVTFDTAKSTAGKLTITSGNLTSANNGLAEVGSLDWSGGGVGGKLTSKGDTTITGASAHLTGELILGDGTTTGTTTWSGSALATSGTAKIKNSAHQTFEATAGGTLSSDGSATFDNQGIFRKSGVGTVTDVHAQFTSTGAILADSGTLDLSGGGSSTGTVAVADGAKLRFSGGNPFTIAGTVDTGATGQLEINTAAVAIGNGAKLNGAGKVGLKSGTTTFSGATESAAEISVEGGIANFTGTHNGTGKLSLTGGGVTGNGSAKIGSLDWSGGDLNGTVIDNSGATTISGTGNKHLSGTLKLAGGGSTAAAVNLDSGATLQVDGADYAFANGAELNGNGKVELKNNKTTFSGATEGDAELFVNGGTAEFAGTHQGTGKFTLTSGTVTSAGGGSASVGSFDWSGGNLNGKIKATQNSHLTGGAKNLAGGELELDGDTTWDGSAINASANAKIKNNAGKTLDIAGDGTLGNSDNTASLENAGIITKSHGNGTANLEAQLENSGTVNVNSGKLRVAGNGRATASSIFNVLTDAELEIASDLELDAAARVMGNGRLRVSGGKLTARGLLEIAELDFDNGELDGTNSFSGTVNWNGGSWRSATATATTIVSGGVLNLGNGAAHEFHGRSLTNYGTINWQSGNLRAGHGSVFTNYADFNDLNGGAKSIFAPGASEGTFSIVNYGTYRKTVGGTTTIEVPFANHGGLQIAAGSIVFTGTFSNDGSIKLANGASAKFSTALTFSADSPLSGTGTIDAPSVTAAGLVSPGASPGDLTITGDLTLLATSTLFIEINGAASGTGYDHLGVGGTATLGGTLSLSLDQAFAASIQPTDRFAILTSSTLHGAFANVANAGTLLTTDGLGLFTINYGAGSSFGVNSVVLSDFTPVPEPSTWILTILGGAFLVWTRRRR